MEKSHRVMVTFFVLVVLIMGLYVFSDWFSKVTGYFTGENEREKLVYCLNENEAKVYGALLSPDWEKQRKILGRSFELLDYELCSTDSDSCKGLKEIPAWYINGSVHYGVKNLAELRDISGCID